MRNFINIEIQGTLESRFWNKVGSADSNECWPWHGYKTKNGYGRLRLAGQDSPMVLASRVSWAIHNGNDAGNFLVCHSCDNPWCVNPSHLFLGTYLDNNLDMKQKGRNSKGEKHGRSKITEAEAKCILSEYRDKSSSMKKLGKNMALELCKYVV